MSIFDDVKSTITTRDAAQRYVLTVSRNGMCRCPFHDDKNPSMKVDKRFHCFGCQADGDVIEFTARLFGFNRKAACCKLASDFGITQQEKTLRVIHTRGVPPSDDQILRHQIAHYTRELSNEYQLLKAWRQAYAPKVPEEEWDPRFVEAVKRLPEVECDLDILLSGDPVDKEQIVRERMNRNQKEVRPMSASITPVYYENGAYARDHKELELFRSSHTENIHCKKAIEESIAKNFDGFRLNRRAVTDVLDQYGPERVSLVLAATVQVKHWDGRFSNENKDWAFTVRMPEGREETAYDRRDAYAVTSHPAILDGFISHARRDISERSKVSIREELKRPAVSMPKPAMKQNEMER